MSPTSETLVFLALALGMGAFVAGSGFFLFKLIRGFFVRPRSTAKLNFLDSLFIGIAGFIAVGTLMVLMFKLDGKVSPINAKRIIALCFALVAVGLAWISKQILLKASPSNQEKLSRGNS